MQHRVLTVAIVISYVFGVVVCQDVGPKVEISLGELQGIYLKSRENRQYSAFLGIPYSKITNRFQLAEAPEKWEGVKDATKFGENCPQAMPFTTQFKIIGSEDCLFLNVYSPKMSGDFPVMVFIHGGSFQSGGSDIYKGDFFMDEDIVLVTINYRLGMLGFLNTGDGEMEANLGLKDQALALQWVQTHIRNFGGNPEKVTIFGESAGSASVHYHMLSPLSKGLFTGAIMQSGAANNPWAHTNVPEKNAFALGTALGCNTQNSSELMLCLQQKDFSEIHNATVQLAEWNGDPIAAVPSTERPGKNIRQIFLPDSPINIIKSGNYNQVPAIFTINEDEALILKSLLILYSPKLLKEMNEDFLRIFPIAMYYSNNGYSPSQLNDISTKIKKFYFGNKDIGQDTFQNLTDLISDGGFSTGIEKAIALQSKTSNVFSGIFTYKGKYSVANLFGYKKPVVTHADELQYFFPSPLVPQLTPESKVENASKYFVSLWANFARTGNPGAKWTRLEWEAVNASTVEKTGMTWWNLDFPPEKLVNPFKERVQFWKDTIEDT